MKNNTPSGGCTIARMGFRLVHEKTGIRVDVNIKGKE
jgi:hypothetical protein